jgi:hypothetical protein
LIEPIARRPRGCFQAGVLIRGPIRVPPPAHAPSGGTSEKRKLTTCEETAATGKIALGTKTFRMMGPLRTTLSRPLVLPTENRLHPSSAVTTYRG